MLILDSQARSIELDLNVSHTTNPLRGFASWRDISTSGYTPGFGAVDTNGTTEVVAVPAPAEATQRVIDYISVYNSDSVAHTVTVLHVDGVTKRPIISLVLGIGEVLQYVEGKGWSVLTINGSQKLALVGGTNAVSSGLNSATLNANVVNNNAIANTIQDVTGLQFPVTTGQRYWFRFVIHYDASATAVGTRWSINGPTATDLNYNSEYSLTTTSKTMNEGLSAYDTPAATNLTSAATNSNVAIIEGFIQPSADGNVVARFASEVAAAAITALRGSFVQYMAVG